MKPYTYLIGWSSLKLFYYGVRYAQKCDPSDLWVKYFTSSKRVKQVRDEVGEPDIIQIRKTFDSKSDALRWEETVIRRMNAVSSEQWLNMQNAGKTFAHSGYPRSVECRSKIRSSRQARFDEDNEFRTSCQERARNVGKRTDVRLKIGNKARERFQDASFAQANIDSHNTPEYKERTSRIHVEQYATNQEFREKHHASINTPEYKELQSKLSAERWENDEYKRKVSDSLKQTLSDPNKRAQMSEASKASTAKRLESRARNKLAREQAANIESAK